MSHKFPTISVTKLFVSIDPRPATEEERWMGLPAIVPGYRPSGNTFIDHFMPLLHAGGALPVEYYAKELEVSVSDLNGAIKVLAGTSVAKFIEDYSLEMAKYMLAHSKSEIRAVAQRCGYSPSGLFRGFSGDALRCRRKIGGGTIVFLDEERSAVKFFVGRRGTLLKLGF